MAGGAEQLLEADHHEAERLVRELARLPVALAHVGGHRGVGLLLRRRERDRHDPGFAGHEAAHLALAVADDPLAEPVILCQAFQQRLAGGGAIQGGREQIGIPVAGAILVEHRQDTVDQRGAERGIVAGAVRLVPAAHGPDDRVHRCGLPAGGLEVLPGGEEGGIEQLQQPVQLGGVELHGGGGEQQQVRGVVGQVGEEPVQDIRLVLVRGAGAPAGMVGLVDDHQVPLGAQQLAHPVRQVLLAGVAGALAGCALGAVGCGEILGGADHPVSQGPDVLAGVLFAQPGDPLGVIEGEWLVELGVQLPEPLAGEVRRGDDQHPLDHAAGAQLLQHQAGLDGLAQAHLVRQQVAVRRVLHHPMGYEHLMRLDLQAGVGQGGQLIVLVRQAQPHRYQPDLEGAHTLQHAALQALQGIGDRLQPQIGLEHGLGPAVGELHPVVADAVLDAHLGLHHADAAADQRAHHVARLPQDPLQGLRPVAHCDQPVVAAAQRQYRAALQHVLNHELRVLPDQADHIAEAQIGHSRPPARHIWAVAIVCHGVLIGYVRGSGAPDARATPIRAQYSAQW